MVWIILIVFVSMLILGALADEEVFMGMGFAGTVIAIIAVIWISSYVIVLNKIDERIAMYQEENEKIERQIAETITQYQEYEKEIFTEVSPDSAITLVSVYPDLKSDTLVQSQIEVYTSNNQNIKKLKEEKINGAVTRWWLYFGG